MNQQSSSPNLNDSTGPSNCFTAQTIPGLFDNGRINPDVGGMTVGIANIASNLFIPILLRYSERHVQTSVIMLLSQVYPNLLATAASIGKNNLTLFDAHFALAVAASPVTIYISISAFRDLLGYSNTLFARISTSAKYSIRLLGIIFPILWISLHAVTSFSTRAFTNSSLCEGMTIPRWIEFQAVSNFIGILDVMGVRDLWSDLEGRGGLGAISLSLAWVWVVYLLLYPVYIRWLRLIWQIPLSCCHVIFKLHPWMVFIIVICLHWSWILGISNGLKCDRSNLSYGQVLSLFSIMPPLTGVVELLIARRGEIANFCQTFPTVAMQEIYFLLFGRSAKGDSIGRKTASLISNASALLFSLVATGAHAAWIYYYVRAGSIPNPRTPVNDPHNAWKPFSVALYIYAYLVCCVNIFLWTNYTDWCYTWLSSGMPSSGLGNTDGDKAKRLRGVRIIFIVVQLLIILPIALLMCLGPLFSPFAALPLAQGYQWEHLCQHFPAEVILQGLSHSSKSSTAVLQVHPRVFGENITELQYYLLEGDRTRQFIYNGDSNQPPEAMFHVSVKELDYDFTSQSISVYCNSSVDDVSHSFASLTPCTNASFTIKPYLTIQFQDIQSGNITVMKTVDPEWQFSDDAPSLILREWEEGQPGKIILQTAVTRRNYCDTLKLCINTDSDGSFGPRVLAAIGVVLNAQDKYATYCSMPRIYS